MRLNILHSLYLALAAEVTRQELPYHSCRNHIKRFESLASKLKGDFREPMIKQQALESKLLFVFRYEWEFVKTSLPFKHKCIYEMYKNLREEKELFHFLNNEVFDTPHPLWIEEEIGSNTKIELITNWLNF